MSLVGLFRNDVGVPLCVCPPGFGVLNPFTCTRWIGSHENQDRKDGLDGTGVSDRSDPEIRQVEAECYGLN